MSSFGFADSSLTPELARLHEEIKGYALGYGLEPFEVVFEMVDSDGINSLAALGDFQCAIRTGASAWTTTLSKGYVGLQKSTKGHNTALVCLPHEANPWSIKRP